MLLNRTLGVSQSYEFIFKKSVVLYKGFVVGNKGTVALYQGLGIANLRT